jgi:hypothetical protein
MKRMGITITGWLAGVLLLSGAMAAGSASALPEVGRCVAQAGTGKYKAANCTEKAGKLVSEKSFEFKKGAVQKSFTGGGGVAVLETASGTKIVCTRESAVGEYNETLGAIRAVRKVILSFKDCQLPLLDTTCRTAGAEEGEFVTSPLKGKLGYVSGKGTKTPTVGQELRPEKAKGPFLEFECAGGAVKVKVGVRGTTPNGNDCIIGTLETVNAMSATFAEAFNGSAGLQSPQAFETTPTKPCNLETNTNGGEYERIMLVFTSTVANEEPLEVKA